MEDQRHLEARDQYVNTLRAKGQYSKISALCLCLDSKYADLVPVSDNGILILFTLQSLSMDNFLSF